MAVHHSMTKFRLRWLVKSRPAIFRLYKALVKPDHIRLLTKKNTELVIEGYPRSGNTFAVVALLESQQREIRIAHHLHAPAQVVAAIRRNIPCLVLIRNPVDAIVSYAIYRGTEGLSALIEDYIYFYEAVEKYRSDILAVDFYDITNDFGLVVERLNKCFGTDFVPFRHTEENVAKVFKLIESYQDGEHRRSRPSESRSGIKEKLKSKLLSGRYDDQLNVADALYQRWKSYAKA